MNEIQARREKYWEEKNPSERIDKLAEAVEILGRSVVELERQNCFLMQHFHSFDNKLGVPMQMSQVEQPWYKTHLLGRDPK